MYENEIDKYRLGYMASLTNNPVILFIGRNGKDKKMQSILFLMIKK